MSWQNIYRDSFRSLQQLKNWPLIQNHPIYDQIHWENTCYPLLIPQQFAEHILEVSTHSTVWKQFFPQKAEENNDQSKGLPDPIADQKFQVTKNLIHRYSNRALLLPTTTCPIICRYCFRKNELLPNSDFIGPDLSPSFEYLKQQTQIKEVIFSGGDPLILSDQRLGLILNQLSEIKHIKMIRFHTRFPVIIPERLNKSFRKLLQTYSDRFHFHLAIHINHLDEVKGGFWDRIQNFHQQNPFVQLLSQSVLLKGINDCPDHLAQLFEKLALNFIRPYYLHHPDRVKGGLHFYLPIEEGRKIYFLTKQKLVGWALPRYVIDEPGGSGKTELFNPETFEYSGRLIGKGGEDVKLKELTYNRDQF